MNNHSASDSSDFRAFEKLIEKLLIENGLLDLIVHVWLKILFQII